MFSECAGEPAGGAAVSACGLEFSLAMARSEKAGAGLVLRRRSLLGSGFASRAKA
jgi:hypothetical protein